MNGTEVLRIVDAIHRDKSIDKEIVFSGIEAAILSAARKHYGEDREIVILIARTTGDVSATLDGKALPPEELGDLLGRIAAQTAKQVMIQKIREAERDALYDEFSSLRTHLVNGVVVRVDHGVASVNLGKVEAILPKSEQIPGEAHRVGDRVRAVVLEVRKAGSRIKVVLSRCHPELVRRLFEVEIPEVAERVIEVRSLAREAGYRSKVAVSCYDNNIDCVGACVGVRGSRIKTIVDELDGERIDIVRWNDSLQVLIPNAMQPAEVEDVILCPMLGRVIVLVREDQLSLAIGKKGQNVRLASKLVGWDIEVMTQEELDDQLERSVGAFGQLPKITDELAESLVSQGFFSFEDLSVIEPDHLKQLSGLEDEEIETIIAFAEKEAEREEQETDRRKALEREAKRVEREAAELDAMTGNRLADVETAVATETAPEPVTEVAEAPVEEESEAESPDVTSKASSHNP
ncbi:transcription termination factor NusA [Planctomicrobium piriforme]|uniref:Transcription termination/antitermination protein NusA n=1 Tax=Planctomicrobium piriforme TaxID=1576369 RepID=A0A1I3D4H9_9PLAN|nr:transcription termination factor NusA [Planctomicrobium piriforme]SFH81411.1 N utilization substance protein A [Planctomicrobium piriforme]